MSSPELYQAWMQQEHASLFGGWDRYSTSRLVALCGQFNECRLLLSLVGDKSCATLSDVGCATGRLYRYFRRVWPSLRYKGFDISEAAIQRARDLYPKGDFRTMDGSLRSCPEIGSDIVFCRDVVHHQANPREFLADLYDAATRYLLLRVRTREIGPTVYDTSESCQYAYGRWVPYIVINTSELTSLLGSLSPTPARVVVRRHPVVLGGRQDRYLPKDLYHPETGTAETAVLVEKGPPGGDGYTLVTVETRPEVRSPGGLASVPRRLARRLGL